MAELPQTLIEFSDGLLSDLESGSVTAQEAVSACQQYAFLREALSSRSAQLAEASLDGDSALLAELKGALTQAIERLRAMPSFHAQEPDAPLSEKEIRDAAFLRAETLKRVDTATKTKLASYKDRRREFIHNLVDKYSRSVPSVTEEQVSTVVDGALVEASKSATTQQTKERFAEMMVSSTQSLLNEPLSSLQQKDLKNDLEEVMSEADNFLVLAVTVKQTEKEIVGAIYDHLELKRPDVLADVALHAPDGQPDTITHGLKLAQVAESLEAHPKERSPSAGFLTHERASGAAKGLQAAADGIMGVFGEPFREMVYHQKINGVFRSMLSNTQQFTDRLGEAFVHSALFSEISHNLNKALSEKPVSAQAGSVVGDVFSSIFRGPLDPALTQAARERVFDYFELARASAGAPGGRSFLPPGALPWEAFAVPGVMAGSYLARRRRAGGPFGSLASLFGFIPGANALTNLTASALDGVTSFVFTNPFLGREMARGRRAMLIPTRLLDDLPLLVAIVTVGTIALLFFIPSPSNLNDVYNAYKVGTLFASLYDKTADLFNTANENVAATTFRCSWSDATPPPTSPISFCPSHAPITQRPFDPNGSHKNLNAYDLASPMGSEIRAAHDGFVVSYDNFYKENEFKLASYGNNVVLVATDPVSKQQYCTNYAHMLDVAPIVQANKGKPVMIQAGTVVGWADTTGYTYGCQGNQCGLGHGTHLHFGYQGPNQSTPISLPPGCP